MVRLQSGDVSGNGYFPGTGIHASVVGLKEILLIT
jgi:hypothetical protein